MARNPKYLRLVFGLALLAGPAPSTDMLFAGASVVVAAEDESAGAVDRRPGGMARRFERSLAEVEPMVARYGYAASVAAVTIEGVGIPAPGQTLLMASSLEAAAGRMNIVLVLFLVAAAATVGNSIGYAIGRWGGRAVLEKLKVNRQRQQRLEDLFRRRGGTLIVLGRFVDGLRQLNGIVAGILQMPWWTFTANNIAGAMLWTFTWGLGTYYLGKDMHIFAAVFHRHRALLFMLGVIAFAGLIAYLIRFRIIDRR